MDSIETVHQASDGPVGSRFLVVFTGDRLVDRSLLEQALALSSSRDAELIGIYVRSPDAGGDTELALEAVRRELAEQGGTYHEVVADNPLEGTRRFAETERCTDIVVGDFRRRRRGRIGPASVGIAAGLLRSDMQALLHIVPTGSASAPPLRLVARRRGIGLRRIFIAVLLGAGLLAVTTIGLHPGQTVVSLQSILLMYLLIGVVVAAIGGPLPGVAAALGGLLLANWFFTPPFRTWTVADPENLFALIVFLVVTSAVGALVGAATRRAEQARRARVQAEALAASTSTSAAITGFEPLVSRIRTTFGADGVSFIELIDANWTIHAASGPLPPSHPDSADEIINLDGRRILALNGIRLGADDRRVLGAFATRAAEALERERLREEAAQVEALAETDRLRAALLGAVSHDLRTPIASIKASVTSLLETDIDWTPDQIRTFLSTIQTETERLNRLVGQLLDAGRIQVGAVQVNRRPTAPDEVVAAAIASLSTPTARVEVDVDDALPLIETDPVLLERILANLIDNALTHTPEESAVMVRAGTRDSQVTFEVIDHGPGIPGSLRHQIFQPFQRLGDAQTTTGVGLGLAVTRGFLDALSLDLTITTTPGGGTTVQLPLPVLHHQANV